MFKVTSTVSTRSIPSWSQLEGIKRFLTNSLLLELKIIQISSEEAGSGVGTHGRTTLTIQVCNRHRARETARKLGEWLKSSLEDILVEEGLWDQCSLPGEVDGGGRREGEPSLRPVSILPGTS